MKSILLFSLIVSASIANAAPQLSGDSPKQVLSPGGTAIRIVEVVKGLEHPWSVAWLPDGRYLITERAGRLQLISGESVKELKGLPEIKTDKDQKTPPQGGNQGGLLDVHVPGVYTEKGWIYFTFSSSGDDDAVAGDESHATATTLARAKLAEDESGLENVEIIYSQAPATDPKRHYGSRIVTPGDGSILFTIGDRGLRRPAQDLTDPAGSVIRLHMDGGAHSDNPFVNVPPGNLRPEIFSFGHRNNQGLAVRPGSGDIWASDHGPFGGDLLYKVEKGNNYGWPQVSFGREYSTGAVIGIGTKAPGVTRPAYVWPESMAPSGLMWYDADKFPEWKGNLFAGFLLAEQLSRLSMDGDKVVGEEVLLKEEVGRIRDVRQGPDGYIYVLSDASEGSLYRLEPAPDLDQSKLKRSDAKTSGVTPDVFDGN